MYSTYIARQAILDRDSKTIGYELLFRDSPENQFPEMDQQEASSKLIIQNHIHGDVRSLCMGKVAFINFTEKCLINKYPLMFDKKNLVIELVGHTSTTDRLLKILKFYYDKGYKIALTEYDLDPQWDVLFPYLAMIKVDMDKVNAKRLGPIVKKAKKYSIKLAAEKVETNFQLQSLAEVGFSFYQGFFYHKPEIVEGQTIAPIKAQMLNLLSETFNTPLNFSTVSDIISQDLNLTVGLLKMVNNVSTGTRVEIASLKQASAYLGEDKLKQFVSILAISKLTTEKTDEASKQALITGKLMDSIARENAFSDVQELAFITGLLSAIEVIMSMPVSEIIKTMPLAEPIKLALTDHAGPLGELLKLTTNYITGKGEEVTELIQTYSLSADFVHKEFVEASNWCKAINRGKLP